MDRVLSQVCYTGAPAEAPAAAGGVDVALFTAAVVAAVLRPCSLAVCR